MVKLKRVDESELFLESKKDLEDLKKYLGQDLFDDYMKIRDKIPSSSNLNKKYPDFNKEMDENTKKNFIKKYSAIKSDPVILSLKEYKDIPDITENISSNNKTRFLNMYNKMRNIVLDTYSTYREFSKLKKIDREDIDSFISNYISTGDKKKSAKSEGAEKLYDGKDWVVYRITTYPAAQLYGKGTKWCITGRYPGHEGKGEGYFIDYIEGNNLDGGYYFFIDKKDPSRKFCALRYEDGSIHSIWNAEDSVLSDVDRDEAPFDLRDIADDLPNGLGDDIMDYIENESGGNVTPEDLLIEELKKGRDSWSDDRIDRYFEYLDDVYGGLYNVEWDDFYKSLNEDAYIDGFKEILDRGGLPSISFLSNKVLDPKCLDALVNKFLTSSDSDFDDTKEKYGEKLFTELIYTYGRSYYKEDNKAILDDVKRIVAIINNCPDDLFNRDINFDAVVDALGDRVIFNKDFISACFKHGLSKASFLKDLSYVYDRKKAMSVVKAAVEAGMKLNDKDMKDHGETNFAYIIANLNPSVEDVKWMIAHGADPNIVGMGGDTAIEYTSDPKIKELLK